MLRLKRLFQQGDVSCNFIGFLQYFFFISHMIQPYRGDKCGNRRCATLPRRNLFMNNAAVMITVFTK